MDKNELHECIKLWYRNQRPTEREEYQVDIALPLANVPAIIGRVIFLFERNTYAFEIGSYSAKYTFSPFKLYVNRTTRWIVRQQVRRSIAVRHVLGLYDIDQKPKDIEMFFTLTTLPASVAAPLWPK